MSGSVEPAAGNIGGGLLAALLPLSKGRGRRALTAYAVGSAAWATGQKVWTLTRERVAYALTIRGDDAIYPDVHAWLLTQIPSGQQRSLDVRTQIERASGHVEPVASGPGGTRRRRTAELSFFYDGHRSQSVRLDGFKVGVAVDTPTINGSQMPLVGEDSPAFLKREESVTFTCYSVGARDAVVAMLAKLAENRAREDRPPTFYLGNRWGGWDSQQDVSRRQLDTVVLRAGQLEGIIADIADFLAVEADYARLGVPYHRGYLLHGPPGTGKTSVARALATYFDLDVYFLALSDLEADASVLQTVSQVRARSMLVIEDVDVVQAAQDRSEHDDDDTTGKKMSLSGLLNALDGIATPHGLITVMTTNRREVLDDALVRPGRIDRVEEIGYLDNDQLHRLVHAFLGIDTELGDPPPGLTPAEIVEVVKRNLHDPQAALDAIIGMLGQTWLDPMLSGRP